MKNKIFLFTLFIFAITFAVFSCKKGEHTALTSDIQNTSLTLPQLKVENNTLYFTDMEQFNSVMNILAGMSDHDILEWTRSMGFVSTADYYDQALEGNCCPDTEGNWERLKSQYEGKVKFDDASGDIAPLYEAGLRNFIVNEKGEFFTGKTLQKYADDKLISIYEPTEAKIAAAMAVRAMADTVNHIYVHPHIVDQNSPEIDERACPKVLGPGGSTIVNCCVNGPLYGNQSSPYKYKVENAERTVYDDSMVNVGEVNGGTFTVYNIQYTSSIYFHCRKRGIFGTWPTCHRTVWNYSATLAYSHNLGSGGGPSPSTLNYTNVTTGSECKYLRTDAVCGLLTQNASIYNNRSVTVSSMSVEFKTSPDTGVLITGSNSNCL